jgi:hypothetical protein
LIESETPNYILGLVIICDEENGMYRWWASGAARSLLLSN